MASCGACNFLDVIDCNGCVLGKIFTDSDQLEGLQLLVDHFSSVAYLKIHLDVLELAHGVNFVKFYTDAILLELVSFKKHIEALRTERDFCQSETLLGDERIAKTVDKIKRLSVLHPSETSPLGDICICFDGLLIHNVVECKGCLLGRTFTHSDQLETLKLLVKHFTSASNLKLRLEGLESAHGVNFMKFYVDSMHVELVHFNKHIDSLREEQDSFQSVTASFEGLRSGAGCYN